MIERLPQLVPAAVMQVGALDVAVPLKRVRRFLLAREISPLPAAPRSLLSPAIGLCQVAGRAAVALDLADLLGEPRRESWPPNLGIFGESGETGLVLLGGRVRWVGRLRRALGEKTELSPFSGALEWRGAAVPLLAWDELLSAAASREL